MHAKIYAATPVGIDAHNVVVEVDLSFGMLQFFIVGLPDRAITESRQRIQTALKNSGIRLPERKITVNLAPADLKKEGTLFDLPIAVGIMQASKYIEFDLTFLEETLFLGELSLDGSIPSIKGALAIAFDAKKLGKRRIVLSYENAHEAALIEGIEVIGVTNLVQLVAYARKEMSIAPTQSSLAVDQAVPYDVDFSDVKGQSQAKRALQIAAAGRHNILFIGPPGSGKTMLARRLPTLMPRMSFSEVLETTKIYSVSGKLAERTLITQRPFRNPHHTISQAGLVGGGSFPQPGEISLTHNGILFLDELTEFKRSTLEVLRQPLESKKVCISRANHAVSFPASFLLVAALNPCPCGFLGDKKKACTCSPQQIERYLQKLSGPLLDRIDLHINVQSMSFDSIKDASMVQSSADLAQGVKMAVEAQRTRFSNSETWNSSMSATQVDVYCLLTPQAQELIKKAFDRLHLSMRGYHKILKVARTIADLSGASIIDVPHLQEAIMYRSLDQLVERFSA